MNVLSSNEAVEKLLSWKRSHSSLRLVVVSEVAEIAGSDVVSIVEVDSDQQTVALTSGPKGWGFRLEDGLITGTDDSLDITIGNIRYVLVRLRSF